jgi:hypothetical protein
MEGIRRFYPANKSMRGAEHYYARDDLGMGCRIYQDGSVEFEFGTASATELSINWIIANLIRVAKTIDNVRYLGCPSSEYLRQKAARFSGGRGSSDV